MNTGKGVDAFIKHATHPQKPSQSLFERTLCHLFRRFHQPATCSTAEDIDVLCHTASGRKWSPEINQCLHNYTIKNNKKTLPYIIASTLMHLQCTEAGHLTAKVKIDPRDALVNRSLSTEYKNALMQQGVGGLMIPRTTVGCA